MKMPIDPNMAGSLMKQGPPTDVKPARPVRPVQKPPPVRLSQKAKAEL